MRKSRPAKLALHAAAVAVSGLALLPGRISVDPSVPARPLLIVHAGGGIAEGTYSNSQEALDQSYAKGHRCFEIDLSWTTDARLVLAHDWDGSFKQWFADADTRPSLEAFKAMEMKDGLTQMTLEDLYEWLRRHEDAHIVTDVKAQNLVALRVIAKTAGSLKETVTMPWEWALPQELRKRGVFVYAHTVNSLDVWRELQGVGVSGIYTDFLTPAEIARVAAVER
ncbi:MAG: hypothetical protein E2O73_09110 [Deltaproteobacteria bacterium]|nr:MAG: hypothetical protein E2O73_09110 [Deltaproteobacteria bacterium]